MNAEESLRSIQEQLAAAYALPNRNWLFGAGASYEANIPLIKPMTQFIYKRLGATGQPHEKLLTALKLALAGTDDRGSAFHIENVLTMLVDYISIASAGERKYAYLPGSDGGDTVRISDIKFSLESLTKAHREIQDVIFHLVSKGLGKDWTDNDPAELPEESKLDIGEYLRFIEAVFRPSDRSKRTDWFFTLNYDTLLEDALATRSIPTWDGFEGGAVAFRRYHLGGVVPKQLALDPLAAVVVKLHGSVDWCLKDDRILRIRDSLHLRKGSQGLLIHPTATKYVATQHDPFAAQFELFRNQLKESRKDGVLITCGYSFGDKHVNDEVARAMAYPSDLKLIVLSSAVNDIVKDWRKHWKGRIIVLTKDGIVAEESDTPITTTELAAYFQRCCKFEGLTRSILSNWQLPGVSSHD